MYYQVPVHVYAWTWTCSMDMGVQHGHGWAAWTRTGTMDMDMHHGHGHAPWTRTCTMDMDMHHGHGHAPWTWICTRVLWFLKLTMSQVFWIGKGFLRLLSEKVFFFILRQFLSYLGFRVQKFGTVFLKTHSSTPVLPIACVDTKC
jgi:hypothetical protein